MYVGCMYGDVYEYKTKDMDNSQIVYGNSVSYANGVYTLGSTITNSNWSALGFRNDTTADVQTYGSNTSISPAYNIGNNMYAVYSRTLTISYNGNSNTSGSTENTKKTVYLNANSTTTSSQTVTLAANGFSRTGHTFSKWAVGSTYGTLPTPTRSGYVFAGWYTNTNYTTQVTSSTIVTITAAQTLYARWQEFLVYVDGVSGSDSNNGYTPATSVKTLKQAYTVAKNLSNSISTTTGSIYIVNTVTISSSMTLDDSYYVDSSGTISGNTCTADSEYANSCKWPNRTIISGIE